MCVNMHTNMCTHVWTCTGHTGTVSQCSFEPISPIELAGLVAQVHGHAAPSSKITARDGYHGASGLWATDGIEGQHGRVLWEEPEI